MVCSLTELQKSVKALAGNKVPVGLLGLHKNTSLVFVLIRFSISFKSYPLSSPTGTQFIVASHPLA